MKCLPLVLLAAAVVLLASAEEAENAALAECGDKFADKVIALSGSFLDKDEIKDILNQVFNMYYKEGKSPREICDYFNANYRNIGLDPEQVDTITSVYTNVQNILGGAGPTEALRQKAMDIAFAFIADDQKQVDATIKGLKDSGASDADAETAVCQQVFAMTTAAKKIQLETKLFDLVPADKLDAVKEQIRRVGKLLTDAHN